MPDRSGQPDAETEGRRLEETIQAKTGSVYGELLEVTGMYWMEAEQSKFDNLRNQASILIDPS